MSDPHKTYLGVRHFASLDGLRCLCILMVMWHHSPAFGSLEDPAMLLRRGFVGVDFFFVLSGFLITTLILREESRDGRFSLSAFWWRRILRIVPVYFLVVSAVSFWWIVVRGEWELARLLPYYYLFLSNFLAEDIPLLTITWSLAMEEQFYLFWPILMFVTPALAGSRGLLLVLLIGLNLAGVMGLGAALGLRPIEAGPLHLSLLPVTYAPLLLGALAAVVLHDGRGFGLAHRLLGWRMSPACLFVALILALQFTPGDLTGWPNLLVHSLMALIIVALVVHEDNGLAPVLTRPWVVRMGVVSYGIYLYHLIARHVAIEAADAVGLDGKPAAWFVTLAMALLAVAVAEVSYRTFEKVFRDLRHRPPRRIMAVARTPGE